MWCVFNFRELADVCAVIHSTLDAVCLLVLEHVLHPFVFVCVHGQHRTKENMELSAQMQEGEGWGGAEGEGEGKERGREGEGESERREREGESEEGRGRVSAKVSK